MKCQERDTPGKSENERDIGYRDMFKYNTLVNSVNEPMEQEQSYEVELEITRTYTGTFFGTKEYAIEQAERYFKRRDGDFDLESFNVVNINASEKDDDDERGN